MELFEFNEQISSEMDDIEVSDWNLIDNIKDEEDIALLIQSSLIYEPKIIFDILYNIATSKHNKSVLISMSQLSRDNISNNSIKHLINRLGFTINDDNIEVKIPEVVSRTFKQIDLV